MLEPSLLLHQDAHSTTADFDEKKALADRGPSPELCAAVRWRPRPPRQRRRPLPRKQLLAGSPPARP